MARHIHLQPHLSVDDLERRYRAAKEPNERTWWQLLWLLAQGRTATELSAVTGYRASSQSSCHRSEEHTSELQSHLNLVCRPLLEKKKKTTKKFKNNSRTVYDQLRSTSL